MLQALSLSLTVSIFAVSLSLIRLLCRLHIHIHIHIHTHTNIYAYSSLVSYDNFLPFGPNIDNKVLTEQPLVALQNFVPGSDQTAFLNVDSILSGTNTGEGVLFVYPALEILKTFKDWEYRALVKVLYPDHHGRILLVYPPKGDTVNNKLQLASILTDQVFACPNRIMLRAGAKSSFIPTHGYQFNVKSTFPIVIPALEICYNNQVCHGSELVFVFGTGDSLPSTGGWTWSADQQETANQMMTYWTSFAKYRSPNSYGQSIPNWPTVSAKPFAYQYMRFDDSAQTGVVDDYLKRQCNLWDSIGYTGKKVSFAEALLKLPKVDPEALLRDL